MDLLDRLLGHDLWTTRQLLRLCEPLGDEALDREFDVGHRSLRATFEHVVFNVEAWTASMAGRPVERGGGRSPAQLADRLDQAAKEFATIARGVADRGAWDETWTDPGDGVERTWGGSIAHLITHSMHHRAQLLYLMRLSGVEDLPEGDVLSWEFDAESEEL